tara:strand:- start:21 stop:521 length:501 start_codon:yes stop_codon:yes gene_type:complete
MKNNKPEWLLKAEQEQSKFNESEWGKLTEKEFIFKEKQQHANQCANQVHKENNWNNFDKIKNNSEHQSKAGLAARDKHRSTGFFKRFTKMGAEATQNKFKTQRLNRTKLIADAMQEDVSYTLKEIWNLDISLSNRQIQNLLRNNDNFDLILKTAKQGVLGTYKKIK